MVFWPKQFFSCLDRTDQEVFLFGLLLTKLGRDLAHLVL
jgi:hypothetical protein